MTIAIRDFMRRVAIDLYQDEAFTGELWSLSEMLENLNYAESDFYRRSGAFKVDITMDANLDITAASNTSPITITTSQPHGQITGARVNVSQVGGNTAANGEWLITVTNATQFSLVGSVGNSNYTSGGIVVPVLFSRPPNMSMMDRVSFEKRKLRYQPVSEFARENRSWLNQPAGRPRYFHLDRLPGINNFEVDRMPNYSGTFRIFGVERPEPHQSVDEDLNIPDAWEQYIRWEVLALALGKDGEGQDLDRSAYAHKRYLGGVSLAQSLLMG